MLGIRMKMITRERWIMIGSVVVILAFAAGVVVVAQERSAKRVMVASCMNNQTIIASTIDSIRLVNNWTNGVVIMIDKVTAYLRDGKLPQCPCGGQYSEHGRAVHRAPQPAGRGSDQRCERAGGIDTCGIERPNNMCKLSSPV